MKKKAGELLRLARNALEKAGAYCAFLHKGIGLADDLLGKIEKLAA